MDESPGTRPRRGRPPVTSDEEILDVAVQAFAARGFDAVSLRDLNRELGTSHGMLTKRYRSKDALWRAAVRRAFDQHLAALPAPPPAPSTPSADLSFLREALVAFVTSASEHPELSRIVGHEGCVESGRVDVLFDEVIRPQVQVLEPVLARCVAAGLVRDVSWRQVFFLVATGAAAVHALEPLNRRFEAVDGVFDAHGYAVSVAELLLAGLRS